MIVLYLQIFNSQKHPSVTDPEVSIFSPGRQIFHQIAPFCHVAVLSFSNTQMIRAGCVKAAQGKPQSSRVKLKISPGTGEAKFSLGVAGEKNPLGRVSLGLLQRGVQNNMVFKISALGAFSNKSFRKIW